MRSIANIIFYIVLIYIVVFLLSFPYENRYHSFCPDIIISGYTSPLKLRLKKVKFANPIIKSIHIY